MNRLKSLIYEVTICFEVTYTVSQKCTNFETVWLKILWIVFDFFAMQRSGSSSVRPFVLLSTDWLSGTQEGNEELG